MKYELVIWMSGIVVVVFAALRPTFISEASPAVEPPVVHDALESFDDLLRPEQTGLFAFDSQGNILVRGEVRGIYGRHAQQATWPDVIDARCMDSMVALAADRSFRSYTLICLSVAPEIDRLMHAPADEDP